MTEERVNKEEMNKKSQLGFKTTLHDRKRIKIFDKEAIFNPKDIQCDDITAIQCEELQKMKFDDDPEKLFSEVRSIEERYTYEIEKTEQFWAEKIEEAKAKYEQTHNRLLDNRKKEISFEIEKIKTEIEKNLSALEAQENVILSHIDMLYELHKEELIPKALDILKMNFLSNVSNESN